MEETKNNNPTSSNSPSPTSNPTSSSPDKSPTPSTPKSNDEGKGGGTDNPTPANNNRPAHHQTFTNNGTIEHSDSTMSNPINDKVDTSEKSGDSTEDNTPFDLSYFEGIYKTKEKDPLDLSYFESPYDKNKLEDYLKSNVESGNQLAYNAEDFTEVANRIDNAPVNSNLLYEAIFNEGSSFRGAQDVAKNLLRKITGEVNRNGRVSDRSINALNQISETIDRRESADRGGISSPYDEAFRSLKREIEFAKQKAEDIKSNGVTKNTGISAESERQQIEDSLAPAKNRLRSAYESGSPTEIENAKRAYERVANRVKQDFEGSGVMESDWNYVSKPEVFYQKLEEEYGPAPTEDEYEPEDSTEETPEPARTESVPETSTSSSTSVTEDDLASVTRERQSAEEEMRDTLGGLLGGGVDSFIERLLREDNYDDMGSAEEIDNAIRGHFYGLNGNSYRALANWIDAQNRERQIREALASTPRGTERGETPTADETPRTEVATTESETPETPATETETPTEVAMAESSETSSETPEDGIPEEIPEEPSEETKTVMDAMEHLDGRWYEFGSEDYERTRKQIARISPSAEEEFMDFADLINDITNGSAGDKVKAVLKLLSKATWDTFNILPKVCADVAKDIVYRLIKGDYDTSGLSEGEQKQVQRFAHNKRNVDMMNAMLNTMDKPIESSIRGKGRGQATDESDYNEGLIEETNDVVSDVTKKYIISQPWIFKAIQRW